MEDFWLNLFLHSFASPLLKPFLLDSTLSDAADLAGGFQAESSSSYPCPSSLYS
jgi:hypothetical protein